MKTYAGNLELNKFSLFKSDTFTHKSFLFYPSVCVLQIFEVGWEGEMQQYEPLLWVQKFCLLKSSLFCPSVCVISSHTQILSVLPFCVLISSHTQILCSSLLCSICSHTSPLCSTLLSVLLSVYTQVISVLPICLCFYLFTHTQVTSVLPFCLCFYLFTNIIPVLPFCLCYNLFTPKSSLFYPSVCLCSSDLWGGPGRRDAAVWAIQGAAQPPASVARVTHHQLCWHSVTGSAHCPSRGPCGM